ncbi:MAG: glucose-1-phosphate adenylyltransferase [Rhodospirillales bacterium]|nr:glucose-1-phosphate adenylyltransferase [Rhodospirillales bacterium]MCW8862746.1 glucose-1-phosphate adenylyltransferase [Rhodospirillales bacterium]MCW8952529.1 glucose-1-phosphate adenylyltransferase [Rhodospirillales bacterium]MCW8970024.1 glucose-1-phosphate adenylyltransferase [Rhodospirillales bacterium]MCW9001356.1 glucose-1-phosphate adenylyltransferase [Rhodospirillales bacterium]
MERENIDLNRALKRTLALVLAGGRGSRLMQLTESQSKPAVPFAGKFRIIDFPLSNCINSGIRRVGVATQYKAHTLIQHIQSGWGFFRAELHEFVEVWPAQQQTDDESWYSGTADAVYQNINIIKGHAPEYVLILAGDHVYKQDYSRLITHHIKSGADVTVSCIEVPRTDATGFGVVDADAEGNILGFLEKPDDPPCIPGRPDTSFASMGIYVFNADFLYEQLLRDQQLDGSTHDFGKDIIPYLVGRCKLMAHRFSDSCVISEGQSGAYWRDVGTLDAYWEANLDLTHVTPALDLYDSDWPIWTYQVQRPAAKFVFDEGDRRGTAIDSLVSAGCVVSGGLVRRSLLFSNVRVNSYAEVVDSVILPDCNIGRNARLKKAVLAKNCRIPPGTVIGEDAKEDARRFYRSKGGVTLVTPAMLARLPQEQ